MQWLDSSNHRCLLTYHTINTTVFVSQILTNVDHGGQLTDMARASVQTLSGMLTIPNQYVKPLQDRPEAVASHGDDDDPNPITIPVLNLSHILGQDEQSRCLNKACREWGFFQVVDHGVSHQLMSRILETWREFFMLPMEVKQQHSNSPPTYEGYGSRLGVEKEAVLDWCDYYFLHCDPQSVGKWPSLPTSCRAVLVEYGEAMVELSQKLMKLFSSNLGLPEGCLLEAFGKQSACLRANFYPKCPQPDLTLGLSAHSDPGGLTLLLADQNVAGLQVRKGDKWVNVKPLPDAFIVNLGDQIQILSNGQYRSVEHRATVNSQYERISVAFFYNPHGAITVKPVDELTMDHHPPLYPSITFNEYRSFIRRKGLHGKAQVQSLKLPN